MQSVEALTPLSPDKNHWQTLLRHVSTGFFILNHLLAGRFAISFPQYVDQAAQVLVQDESPYSYFLPLVFSPPKDIRDNPYCRQQFPEAEGYTLNPQEQEIEQLLLTDPGQKRTHLELSVALSQAARRRAQDMADRAYFHHTNPDGFGPNCIVLQEEFTLPDDYDVSNTANNVETIAGGYSVMADAWAGLTNSTSHANHLLGKGSFYGAQTFYGIGYVNVPGSQYGHYLVIIIAKKK
jgi:hypothetical protein